MFTTSPHNEKELFRLLVSGDETAFRMLFHHNNRLLSPFIMKLTGSAVATQEVLQEIFLKLWLHRERLTDVENPKAWMIRMASNESLNYLRRLATEGKLLSRLRNRQGTETVSPELDLEAKEIRT